MIRRQGALIEITSRMLENNEGTKETSLVKNRKELPPSSLPPDLLIHSALEEEIRVSEAGAEPVGEAAVRFVRLQILKDFSLRHADSKEYACNN